MSVRRGTSSLTRHIGQQKRSVTYNVVAFPDAHGPGGRASTTGITATVFGAYGSVGRYFLDELGKRGTRVFVPFRGCELEIRHLKPMFDLGQLGLMPYSPRDRDSIRESIKKSDIVINMIGKHYETKHLVPTRRADGNLSRVNYSLEEVHVTIPRTIAEVCKEVGVEKFIHVSALSADINSSSIWSQTKARGEIAVREVIPDSIIVKPATIFGPEDRFLTWIAEAITRMRYFPLLNNGSTLVQPVYAHDVGKALHTLVQGYDLYAGKTVQLAGPAEYTYKEVAEFVSDVISRRKPLVDVPVSVASTVGRLVEELVNPVLTRDMVAQMTENVLPHNNPEWLNITDLGIEPASMDRVSFEFLHRFRKGGHFTLVQGYH